MGNIFIEYYWVVILAIIWTVPWKIIALWKSARRGHLFWFILLFFLNTLALLEIIYLMGHREKKEVPQEDPENIIHRKKERTKVIKPRKFV